MRARAALAIAAALLAGAARGQTSDGPQGSPPAEPAPAAPALAGVPSSYRGAETSLALIAGAGGALELTIVGAWKYFALGVYGGLTSGFHGVGTTLGVVGGPRIRLGDETRLDLLGDAGVALYGSASGIDLHPYGTSTSATIATAGLRIGLTFEWPRREFALTLGAAARWMPETNVDYTVHDCSIVPLGGCPSHTETDTWGGPFAGLYVAVGSVR